MRKLYLANIDDYALIDSEDFDKVSGYAWYASRHPTNRLTYVVANAWKDNGKKTSVMLSRVIMDETDPKVCISFKNSNGLDCRKKNLRRVSNTRIQQTMRTVDANQCGYKGVSLYPGGKYIASIQPDHERMYLGSFTTPEDAATAYNLAAKKHFGKLARLNKIKGRNDVN